jgi:hypothetical protein
MSPSRTATIASRLCDVVSALEVEQRPPRQSQQHGDTFYGRPREDDAPPQWGNIYDFLPKGVIPCVLFFGTFLGLIERTFGWVFNNQLMVSMILFGIISDINDTLLEDSNIFNTL